MCLVNRSLQINLQKITSQTLKFSEQHFCQPHLCIFLGNIFSLSTGPGKHQKPEICLEFEPDLENLEKGYFLVKARENPDIFF